MATYGGLLQKHSRKLRDKDRVVLLWEICHFVEHDVPESQRRSRLRDVPHTQTFPKTEGTQERPAGPVSPETCLRPRRCPRSRRRR